MNRSHILNGIATDHFSSIACRGPAVFCLFVDSSTECSNICERPKLGAPWERRMSKKLDRKVVFLSALGWARFNVPLTVN